MELLLQTAPIFSPPPDLCTTLLSCMGGVSRTQSSVLPRAAWALPSFVPGNVRKGAKPPRRGPCAWGSPDREVVCSAGTGCPRSPVERRASSKAGGRWLGCAYAVAMAWGCAAGTSAGCSALEGLGTRRGSAVAPGGARQVAPLLFVGLGRRGGAVPHARSALLGRVMRRERRAFREAAVLAVLLDG